MLLRFWHDELELITIFKTQVKFVINKIVRVKAPGVTQKFISLSNMTLLKIGKFMHSNIVYEQVV